MKEETMKKTWVVCLCAMVCCLLWGSAFPCVKIGYQLFQIPSDGTATQILFAGCRFTLAGILAVIIGSFMQGSFLFPKKSSWGMVLKLSGMQTILQYIFFYIGLAHASGVKSSIIEATNVFFSILVASLLFRQEKLTSKKIFGCILGFAGVVLINLNGAGLDSGMTLAGEGSILLSTVAYAFSAVFIKRYSKYENTVALSGYQFLIGGVIMMLIGFVAGGRITHITGGGMVMLLYLAFISAVAYSLWGILLKYNPVSRVSVFGFMNPVFGVILSAWFLQEKEQALGIKSVVSLILVCVGIYVVNHVKKQEINQ